MPSLIKKMLTVFAIIAVGFCIFLFLHSQDLFFKNSSKIPYLEFEYQYADNDVYVEAMDYSSRSYSKKTLLRSSPFVKRAGDISKLNKYIDFSALDFMDPFLKVLDIISRDFDSEAKPFTRYEGDVFGMDKHVDFSALDFMGPFWRVSGISSGDFNNDGWQDIIFGNRKGILLYKNLGTGNFALQEVTIPEIKDLSIIVVAFVDIDNDGWQDIYITSYGGINYFILNDRAGFQNPRLLEVPNTGAILTEAASFGDLNKDGNLDFVQGNWFFGRGKLSPSKGGIEINKLIMNKDLKFVEENLKEIAGQTLAILFSDFTNDNNLDLLVGNDFREPDIFHIGDGEGELREILREDNIIPVSAGATMSIDTADFNNDLYTDIYVVGISSTDDNPKNPCFEIKNIQEKQACEKNVSIRKIVRSKDVAQCISLAKERDKNECITMIMMFLAWKQEDETLCHKISQNYKVQKTRCHAFFLSSIELLNYEKFIGETNGNVLLKGSSDGTFKKVVAAEEGNWSWNAKFADLDNDEWQDIYVATGFMGEFLDSRSNVFFHNYQGERFEAKQKEFGLENFNVTSAYTYIDIDNDGDLDIVTAGLNGPINVYINNETKNNSITFEFRDKKGNFFGIGNKVYIYYGEDNRRHQVREIKSGGGFLSFDSPIAHFGLGQYDVVNRVEIIWSTGEKTVIDKEFLANRKYVVMRGE